MWILSGSRQRHPTTTSTLWWHCRCRSATAYSSDNKCPLSSQLTSLHIWRSFPYPPPGEAVGSWQLSPTALQKRALYKYTYLYLFTFTMRYDSAIFLRSSTGIGSQHGLPYAPEVTRTELERAKDRVWSYDASAAAFPTSVVNIYRSGVAVRSKTHRWKAQWTNRRMKMSVSVVEIYSQKNCLFRCPALDLQLMGDHLCG